MSSKVGTQGLFSWPFSQQGKNQRWLGIFLLSFLFSKSWQERGTPIENLAKPENRAITLGDLWTCFLRYFCSKASLWFWNEEWDVYFPLGNVCPCFDFSSFKFNKSSLNTFYVFIPYRLKGGKKWDMDPGVSSGKGGSWVLVWCLIPTVCIDQHPNVEYCHGCFTLLFYFHMR